jgi:hypothetical protein
MTFFTDRVHIDGEYKEEILTNEMKKLIERTFCAGSELNGR